MFSFPLIGGLDWVQGWLPMNPRTRVQYGGANLRWDGRNTMNPGMTTPTNWGRISSGESLAPALDVQLVG